MILDTIYNRKPHLQHLVDTFNIRVRRTVKQIEFDQGEVREFKLENTNSKSNTHVTACFKTLGRGQVAIVTDSRVFGRVGMGGVLDKENSVRRKIYQVVYEVFENRFQLKPNMKYPL